MKLNIWQWLGIILVIGGVIVFARRKTAPTDVIPPATTNSAPATTPAAR